MERNKQFIKSKFGNIKKNLKKYSTVRRSIALSLCFIMIFSLINQRIIFATSGPVAPLVHDTFESYPVGNMALDTSATSNNGWKAPSATTIPTVTIQSRTDGTGKYAEIKSTDTASRYFGQVFSKQTTGIMITEFDINLPTASTPTVIMYDSTSMNGGNIVFRMVPTTTDLVLYDSAGTVKVPLVTNYDIKKWYHFKVRFDIPNKKYYITVTDGTNTVYPETVYNFYSTAATTVGTIAFQPKNSIINLDNVKIYQAIGLTGLGVSDVTTGSSINIGTFSTDITSYTATVKNNVSSIQLTPQVANPDDVSITVNNVVVSNNTTSQAIQLNVGDNTVTVGIAKQAYSDINKSYTIKITRLEAAPDVKNASVRAGDGNLAITWDETNLLALASVNIYSSSNTTTPLINIPAGTGSATITGLTNGTEYTYIIKGVASDGIESAGVTVKGTPVLVSVTGVSLDNILVTLLPGANATLTANVAPTDANNKLVTWTSMNSSIADVNGTGIVTAKSFGETYVIATTVDGNKMAAVKVVVSDNAVSEVTNANVTQSDSSLILNWEDPSNTAISKINIYIYDPTYNYDSNYATAVFLTSVNRGVKNHTFTGLINGQTYNYILKGVRADGTETFGVRVCGIPNSETLLDSLQLIGVKADGTTTNVDLIQNFTNSELAYTAFVTNNIVSIKAIPTVKDPSSVNIIVNGELVPSGGTSTALALSANALTNFGVSVLKKDNSISRSYIPSIFREANTQAFLKDLKISNSKTIGEAFKPRTLTYTDSFDYYTDKVVITATGLEGENSIISINGNVVKSGVPAVVNLSEGANTVTIVETSKTFTSASTTYTLTLNRDSSSYLKDLKATAGVAIRAFDPATLTNYIDVKNNVNTISLIPTTYTTVATVTVNGVAVNSGQTSSAINLNEGSNLINVKVNDTVTYSVYVYRLPQTDYLYVRDEGTTVTIRNKYISTTLDKTNSNMLLLNKPGDSDIIGKGGFGYFLANPSYTNSTGTSVGNSNTMSYGFNSSNTVYTIYYQDENKIDIGFTMNDTSTGPLRYGLHYVINKLEPGVYTYMDCKYDSTKEVEGKSNWSVGQVRWSIRADKDKFTNAQYENGVHKLISPHNVDITSVSDATWLLPDGNIHAKYDLVEYEDHKIYGMTGDKYGIWFIKAQDDYTDGLPTAQELAVHETNTNPIINWAPSAAHYGRTVENTPTDWQYMWGPMLVYVNSNSDATSRWNDASAVKNQQVKEWPYNFITNPLYALNDRGTVNGKINITAGVEPDGTTVILSNPNKNWEYQSSDYTYSAKADKDGNFTMTNVRAGTYKVYAYQKGIYTNYTSPQTVEVKANALNDIGTFVWDKTTFGKKLWEIGVADRTPNEFLHGTDRIFGNYRRYPFEIPNGVDFTIGKSNEKTDWIATQVPTKTFGTKDLLLTQLDDKSSVWQIRFNLDSIPTVKDSKLTIALAASRATSLKILLNGTEIKNYPYNSIPGDDSAYARSSFQGIYKLLEIPFDTSLLKVGDNIVKLDSNRTMFDPTTGVRITDVGSSITYDAIKMETSEPIVVTPITTAATVAAGITSVVAPVKDATSLTLPTVPTGYTIGIKSVNPTGIIGTNGTITLPAADTMVTVVFTVTNTSDNTTADTISINILVPAKTVVPAAVDKTVLTSAISNATTLIGSKIVGTAVGNVPQVAKDTFQSVIDAATLVNANTAASQVEVDDQVAAIATATTNFNNAVITTSVIIPTVTVTDSNSNIVATIDSSKIDKDKVNVIVVNQDNQTKAEAKVQVQIPASSIGVGTGSFEIDTKAVSLSIPTSIIDSSLLSSGGTLQVSQNLMTTTEANALLVGIPAGAIANGKVFTFGLAVCDSSNNVVSEIHNFAGDRSVGVTINLSNDDIKGMDTSRISAFYYDTTSKKWIDMGGSFDTVKITYTFNTTHFTDFTIMQKSAIVVDKTALATAISDATTLLGSKTVGTAVGNVPQIAKDAFQSAITTAAAINVNTAATQVEVDAQIVVLATATINFNNAVIVAPVLVTPVISGGSGGDDSTGVITPVVKTPEEVKPIVIPQAAINRLSGLNRIETSIAIAKEQYTDKKPDAVVLATADGFADALAGSGLAYKNNAPLLLVNKTIDDSKNVLDYVTTSLSKDKIVYILGETGVISKEISDYLIEQGYKVVRLGGKDRYETNQKIVDSLNVVKGTSLVIATGDGFADALSISSIADIKGFPVLLNAKDNLSANVSNDIMNLQPTTVYVIGGEGVLSTNIEEQIKNLNGSINIVRLGGKDRYETSMMILDYFNIPTTTIALATGIDFPDALSGSVLAARKSSGVLLVDNKDVTKQKELLSKEKITNVIVFGGEGVIGTDIATSLIQK